jgi:prepilin-type N-terminal cleavage/methylation domain-containing protein
MKERKSILVCRGQEGFTLLEILIAITLLAFMTMAVISITQNATDTMERTTEVNKNNLQIETALSRFEWDFSQIYSPLFFSTRLNLNSADPFGSSAQENGSTDDNTILSTTTASQGPVSPELQEYYQRLQVRFEQNDHFNSISQEGLPIPKFYSPDKTTFEFFTTSNRRKIQNTKQSHFAWVRYTLGENRKKDDDAGINNENKIQIPQGLKSLVRYYSADDPYGPKKLDPEDEENVKGAILLENVERLEFQFWDMSRRKWETSLRAIPDGESLLRGVKISISWYDSNGIKREVERIFRNHWPMEGPRAPNPNKNRNNTNELNPNGNNNTRENE